MSLRVIHSELYVVETVNLYGVAAGLPVRVVARSVGGMTDGSVHVHVCATRLSDYRVRCAVNGATLNLHIEGSGVRDAFSASASAARVFRHLKASAERTVFKCERPSVTVVISSKTVKGVSFS